MFAYVFLMAPGSVLMLRIEPGVSHLLKYRKRCSNPIREKPYNPTVVLVSRQELAFQ